MRAKNIQPILDRIRHKLRVKTDKELCEAIGIKYPTLDTWKNRDKIPDKRLEEIAKKLGVTKEWLLHGEGDIFTSDEKGEDSIEAEVVSVRPGAGLGDNLEAVDLFSTGEKILIDRSLFKTPPKGKLRAMQVDGYSMVPMLFPDSWVIIDETNEFVGDGLYVINVDNVLMVKLIERNLATGNLWVKSVNPQYDSWEIKDEDQRVFEIYGKVIRCII